MLTAFATAFTPLLGQYIYVGGGFATLIVIVLLVLLLRRRR
jgi:hypothetical protein